MAAKMLPVRIEAASTVVPIIRHTPSRKLTRGWIEIEYAEVKIRVRGAVDAEALRVVLEALSGR
jgi:hypothetical protein